MQSQDVRCGCKEVATEGRDRRSKGVTRRRRGRRKDKLCRMQRVFGTRCEIEMGENKRGRQEDEEEEKGKRSSSAIIDDTPDTQRILLSTPASLNLPPRARRRRAPQGRKLDTTPSAPRRTSRVLTRRPRRRIRLPRIRRLAPRVPAVLLLLLVLRGRHRHTPTRRMQLRTRKRCAARRRGPLRARMHARRRRARRGGRARSARRVSVHPDAEHQRRRRGRRRGGRDGVPAEPRARVRRLPRRRAQLVPALCALRWTLLDRPRGALARRLVVVWRRRSGSCACTRRGRWRV